MQANTQNTPTILNFVATSVSFLPYANIDAFLQLVASNTLSLTTVASLMSVLAQPNLPLISQSSLLNLLAPGQLDEATQTSLINLGNAKNQDN